VNRGDCKFGALFVADTARFTERSRVKQGMSRCVDAVMTAEASRGHGHCRTPEVPRCDCRQQVRCKRQRVGRSDVTLGAVTQVAGEGYVAEVVASDLVAILESLAPVNFVDLELEVNPLVRLSCRNGRCQGRIVAPHAIFRIITVIAVDL